MRVRCQVGISSDVKSAVRSTQRPMRVKFQVGGAAPGPHEGEARVTHGAAAEAPRHAISPLASPRAPRSRLPVKAKADVAHASLFKKGAITAAVLITAAGCASLDPIQGLAWKVQPVMNVSHALQSSEDYYRLGRYYDGSQLWDKSIEAYRKAITIDSRNVEAYNALGVALARLQRYDEAEAVLRTAVSIDPNSAHVRSNLGYVLLLAGKPRQAITELKTALKLDRDNATARANLREAVAQWESAQMTRLDGAAGSSTSTARNAPTPAAPASTGATPQIESPAVVSVPAPITAVEVPAPLGTRINVPAPFVTAGVPTPVGVRVIDQPTVAALTTGASPEAGAVQARVPNQIVPVGFVASATLRANGNASQLELSNGNGVTGAAGRLRQWLSNRGVRTSRLTNERPYVQQHTVIQYRSGQEEAAHRVARTLRMTVQPDPAPNATLRTDVRVVLGHDWARSASCLERDTCQVLEKVAGALPHAR